MSASDVLLCAPEIASGALAVREAALAWWWVLPAIVLGMLIARLLWRSSSAGASDIGVAAPVAPAFRSVKADFGRELNRVRRYDRSLAVLVVKLQDLHALVESLSAHAGDNGRGAGPITTNHAALQVMFWNVGYVLRELLRETDLLACDIPANRYVVLLPEADPEEASSTAERITQQVLEHVGVRVRTGIATFRVDGLTVDDLVEKATAKSDQFIVEHPRQQRAISRTALLRVADPGSP